MSRYSSFFSKNIKTGKNKFFNIFSLSHKILIISLIIGMVTTAVVASYSNKTQAHISNNLVRLHIIANSDSQADQKLKLKVRDAIINKMNDKFELSNSISQTRQTAINNIPYIKKVAQKVIARNGKSYDVKVSFENTYFPTKHYGDVTLPAGSYQSLNVKIGKAKGHNWWCVLFPPLCFVDATNGSVPDSSKQRLQEKLNSGDYTLITSSKDNTPVKIKFKSVEIWQKSKHKVKVAISDFF